jgi:anaerobic selenocysteine-containing dehydrogenase
MVNLEGRAQRVRRTVIPPAPDEVAWLAKLGERFGVAIDPHSRRDADGQLPERAAVSEGVLPVPNGTGKSATAHGGPLKLVRYRALFSGPVVERVEELQFQRPDAEIELSLHDAEIRNISTGEDVVVRSNGTAVHMRARVNRHLVQGAVRAPEEHVRALDQAVEVSKQ